MSKLKKLIMMAQDNSDESYMCIEALEDGLQVSLTTRCEYSSDGLLWQELPANEKTPEIQAGERFFFRKNDKPEEYLGVGTFTITKNCRLKGNCNSMLFGDDLLHNDLTGKDWAFYRLFNNCTTIIEVSENFLPATILCYGCYSYMFAGCTSLVSAPLLPATTLAEYSYNNMFDSCALITAPSLPATVLHPRCYSSMFRNCTSLVIAPELPATTLTNYCYQYMFTNCTSLVTAPTLPATRLSNHCYRYMFDGCSNLNYISAMFLSQSEGYSQYWVRGVSPTGIFVKNANATWNSTGVHGVPSGWTVKRA